MMHYSPAPIEIACLPSFELLDAGEDLFERIIEEQTLDSLSQTEIPGFEYLRRAALRIGNIVLDKINPSTALVDIRTGLYDPRINEEYYVPFHFDADYEKKIPVDAYMLCTGSAGYAVIGEARVKGPEEIPDLAEFQVESLTVQNLSVHESVFDITGMKVKRLKPSVLYKLPAGCVHCSPLDLELIGRNFFRVKDIRA